MIIAFGFMDQLFFKLKLYDPDLPNASILEQYHSQLALPNSYTYRKEPGEQALRDSLNGSVHQ